MQVPRPVAYSSKVLMGNWWEDREQATVEDPADKLALAQKYKHMNTKARVQPYAQGAEKDPDQWNSTNKTDFQGGVSTQGVQRERKRMVNVHTLGKVKSRLPVGPKYGLGATLPYPSPQDEEAPLQSTAQALFASNPASSSTGKEEAALASYVAAHGAGLSNYQRETQATIRANFRKQPPSVAAAHADSTWMGNPNWARRQQELDASPSGYHPRDSADPEPSHIMGTVKLARREQMQKEKRMAKMGGYPPPRAALLIIDVQNDFIPPTGSLAVPAGDTVVNKANVLRRTGVFDLVVLSQDWHPPNHMSFHSNNVDQHPDAQVFDTITLSNGGEQVLWPDHCVQGSKGAEFHKDLVRGPGDVVVRKGTHVDVDSYSAFFDNDHKTQTEMLDVLKARGIRDVYCMGLAADFCVGFTALDSKAAGFNTYFVEDATEPVSQEGLVAMKERLKEAGVKFIKTSDV